MKPYKQFLMEVNLNQINLLKKFYKEKHNLSDEQINSCVDYWVKTISKLPDKLLKEIDNRINTRQIRDVISFLPTKKRSEPLLTFKDMQKLVDLHKKRQVFTKKKDIIQSDPQDIIYNRKGLVIKKGSTRDACIKYGNEGISAANNWCISTKDENNRFSDYRFGSQVTIYFVLDQYSTDPEDSFVLLKHKDGSYEIAVDNEGEEEITWNEILEHQPKLKGLEKYFKYDPLSPSEKEKVKRLSKPLSEKEFLTLSPERKSDYISMGHQLSDRVLLSLLDSGKVNKKIFNRYVVRNWKISKDIFEKLTPGQVRAVRRNQEIQLVQGAGEDIEHIGSPSLELMKLALDLNRGFEDEEDYNAFSKIKDPPEEIQIAAVEQHPKSIKYIKNPSDKVKKAAR